MESAPLEIIDARVLTPSGLLPNEQIIISDGKVVEITGQNREIPCAEIIGAKEYYAVPGCIDTRVHGDNGHDFTEAIPKAFYAITRAHALQGTTALYPTLTAAPIDTFRKAIETCEYITGHPEQGTRIMGLHLEGNYLNMTMKGRQGLSCVYLPDSQECKELLNSTQCVKRRSTVPELDGTLESDKYASAHGALVSLAHTTADYLQMKEAYEAGFTHATCSYSAVTSVHKDHECKHEGTVGGIYFMKDMIVEVVADGIYASPVILKLVYQVKRAERTPLITDTMVAVAYDNGTEYFPDPRAIIEEGAYKLADHSAIAGGIATGIRLVHTLAEKAEVPLRDAVHMASESPVCLMGPLGRRGTLEKGKNADIIIFSSDIKIQETFIEGKRPSKE